MSLSSVFMLTARTGKDGYLLPGFHPFLPSGKWQEGTVFFFLLPQPIPSQQYPVALEHGAITLTPINQWDS